MPNVRELRAAAVNHTLFPPTSLPAAIERLGFVQADPIKSPATAQDLILRHRVTEYHAGDLFRHYPDLDIEEGLLYAYGFLPRSTWRLRQHVVDPAERPALEQAVLAMLRRGGHVHPKDLEAEFGRERVSGPWGTNAKATTQALENLAWHGLARVAVRKSGFRLYGAAEPPDAGRMPEAERFRKLIMVVANVLAPVRMGTLTSLASGLRRISFPDAPQPRKVISEMMNSGELEQATVDGVPYLWPESTIDPGEPSDSVRLLAPFDPVVWDRNRFEHFWGWEYRFEAYTPPAKRVRGYYAMPLLWRDDVIGWANVTASAKGKVDIDLGFVNGRPTEKKFSEQLGVEIGRLEQFLAGRRRPIDPEI